MSQLPIISILGSCRQDSIKKLYRTTDLHEETSWPHYTKEILQIIKCAKGKLKLDKDDENVVFRKCILKYGNINYDKIQRLFQETDIFVLEIASRLVYEYKQYYCHHIASEKAYGNPEKINEIKIRSQSDQEIEDDLSEIKKEIGKKHIVIVTHFATYNGKRRDLVNLLKSICCKLDLTIFDPSILLQENSVDNLFVKESVLSHYTSLGHQIVSRHYKDTIDWTYSVHQRKMNGCAIIICGQLRNYWITLPWTMDNIILPNQADVFCVVTNAWHGEQGFMTFDKDELRKHCQEILGSALKTFHFNDDCPEIAEDCKRLSAKFDTENTEINRNNIIHQWIEKKVAFQHLEKYADLNDKTYKTITFVRPDVYYSRVILPIEKINPYDVYLTTRCGKVNCSWMMDNFYFGGYNAMKKIAQFADEYSHLNYVACCVGPEFKNIMEIQFGLFIRKYDMNVHHIKYDIPSRRGERLPPSHPKAVNKLNILYPLKYVIDQISL